MYLLTSAVDPSVYLRTINLPDSRTLGGQTNMRFSRSLLLPIASFGTANWGAFAAPALAAPESDSTLSVMSAASVLQATFHTRQIVLKGSAAYSELNESYLSELNSDLEPFVIFLPATTDEVAKFVQIMAPMAAALGSPGLVAVRGGGQQPAPACNNVQSGITIDLRNISTIAVDSAAGSVAIGAGARWGAVYKKLEPLGLGVAGGRSAANGIGGLALAGGLSFFSSREGFITDNVLDFEVVLASGRVVHANPWENKDLYKALRGGGNNLGIVTKYTMRTFEQGDFWGGSIFYFPASFPGQIDALVAEIKKPNADVDTHLMISIAYSTQFLDLGGNLCLNQIYYTKAVENPLVVQPFTNVQPQIDPLSTLRNLTLVSAANEQNDQSTASQRYVLRLGPFLSFSCASVSPQKAHLHPALLTDCCRVSYMNLHVRADAATLKRASDIYMAGIDPLRGVANITASLTLQPYPVSMLKRTDFQGGNILGLDSSEGPIVSVLFLTWWDDPEDDNLVISTLRAVLEQIRADASFHHTLVPFVYMNYAHDFQDPITSYGKSSRKLLEQASRKYDPKGFFQKVVRGGFKL